MQINGPAYLHGPQPMNAPHRGANPQPPGQSESLSPADQLDISHEADLASRMRDVPEIRADRVAAVKAQIAAGVYETDDKIEGAVDRLLDEIA